MKKEQNLISEKDCHLDNLIQKIDSPNWILRKTVAEELGNFNNLKSAFTCLEKLVTDPDRFVRKSALLSISKFDDKKNINRLLEILSDSKQNDFEEGIKKIASTLFIQLTKKRENIS